MIEFPSPTHLNRATDYRLYHRVRLLVQVQDIVKRYDTDGGGEFLLYARTLILTLNLIGGEIGFQEFVTMLASEPWRRLLPPEIQPLANNLYLEDRSGVDNRNPLVKEVAC